MRYSQLVMMVISVLVAVVASSNAFADTGFACGPRDYNNTYVEHLNKPWCYPNSMYSSRIDCRDSCKASAYCEFEMNGFWYESSDWHEKIIQECKSSCTEEQKQCAPNDLECLNWYKPLDIDCSLTTNPEDESDCNLRCVDNILTSECGKECLQNACSDISSEAFCSNLCTNSYCASIPMHYETRWSVFGVLMTLLAAMSGIILIVMHRKRKDQDSVQE